MRESSTKDGKKIRTMGRPLGYVRVEVRNTFEDTSGIGSRIPMGYVRVEVKDKPPCNSLIAQGLLSLTHTHTRTRKQIGISRWRGTGARVRTLAPTHREL